MKTLFLLLALIPNKAFPFGGSLVSGPNPDAGFLTIGTLPNARLDSSSVTLQGNAFNAASKLVQLDADTKMPAVDGSALTALNASNLASGTVPNARLDSSSVTLQGNAFNAASKLLQLDASAKVPNAQLDSSSVTLLGSNSLTIPGTLGFGAGSGISTQLTIISSTLTVQGAVRITNPAASGRNGLTITSTDADNWGLDLDANSAYGGLIVRTADRNNIDGGLAIGNTSSLAPTDGLSTVGSVGVAINSPASTLHVHGSAQFGSTAVSSFTAAGALNMASGTIVTTAGTAGTGGYVFPIYTIAQLQAATPGVVGLTVMGPSPTYDFYVATGTSVDQWINQRTQVGP